MSTVVSPTRCSSKNLGIFFFFFFLQYDRFVARFKVYEVQLAKDSLFAEMVFEGITENNNSQKTKILEYFTTKILVEVRAVVRPAPK